MRRRTAAPRAPALQIRVDQRQRGPRPHLEHRWNHGPQRGQARRIAGADHRPQDHLERDLGHLGRHRELIPDRPPRDIRAGNLDHGVNLPGHRLAVKRRQHQPAAVAVHVIVDHQDRRLAEQPSQHRVCFAGVKDARIAGEHLLDLVRVGHVHHRARRRDVQREDVAVAPRACRHELWPPLDHQRRLQPTREPRSRRNVAVVI